jgi:hypothetical protein
LYHQIGSKKIILNDHGAVYAYCTRIIAMTLRELYDNLLDKYDIHDLILKNMEHLNSYCDSDFTYNNMVFDNCRMSHNTFIVGSNAGINRVLVCSQFPSNVTISNGTYLIN